MLLRELLGNQEQVFKLFAGLNLDSEVRLSVNPGEVEVVAETPKPEAPASEGAE